MLACVDVAQRAIQLLHYQDNSLHTGRSAWRRFQVWPAENPIWQSLKLCVLRLTACSITTGSASCASLSLI